MTFNKSPSPYFIIPTLILFVVGVSAMDNDVSFTVFQNYDLKSNSFLECGTYNVYFGNSEIKEQCLTPEIRSYIQENSLLAHAYYRIKILLKILDKVYTFHTFIPFSQLVQFNYQYSFKITVDDSLIPTAVIAKVQNGIAKTVLGDSTYIDVYFRHMDQGPQPDTATFIHKMEREREAKEKGANQDNRSFLAKYWIYILPLLIFAVLSGSVNADGNGSQR